MQARLTDAPGSELEPQASGLAWHTLSVERVLRAVEVDAQRGLSSAEAAARAGRFGPNKFAAGRAEPRWHAFIRQYSDPMQIVLLTAGVLSLFPLRQSFPARRRCSICRWLPRRQRRATRSG